MRNLKELAAQAATYSRRSDVLRRTIQVVGNHSEADSLKLELTALRSPTAFEEAEEVVAAIKRLWPTIWEETMRAARAELDEIERRYAPLLTNSDADEPGRV